MDTEHIIKQPIPTPPTTEESIRGWVQRWSRGEIDDRCLALCVAVDLGQGELQAERDRLVLEQLYTKCPVACGHAWLASEPATCPSCAA